MWYGCSCRARSASIRTRIPPVQAPCLGFVLQFTASHIYILSQTALLLLIRILLIHQPPTRHDKYTSSPKFFVGVLYTAPFVCASNIIFFKKKSLYTNNQQSTYQFVQHHISAQQHNIHKNNMTRKCLIRKSLKVPLSCCSYFRWFCGHSVGNALTFVFEVRLYVKIVKTSAMFEHLIITAAFV